MECTDLNDPDKSPSEESRLELSPKTNTSVRAGEYIRYQCIDKALFHETVFGPHIEVFCDVIDGEPTYNTSFTWPICTPLECTCLGDPALTVEQILNITDSSCPSGETIDRLVDVSNKTYPMPKRVNCGTYKPESPNYENKCTCPDLEEPIVYVNEMQILDFTWFAKLGDATTSMFAKRKDIAEVEFDTFYLAQVTFILLSNQKLQCNSVKKSRISMFLSFLSLAGMDAREEIHAHSCLQVQRRQCQPFTTWD